MFSPQTKAAYVLFYQRREAGTPSKSPPSASLGGAPETLDDNMDTNWVSLLFLKKKEQALKQNYMKSTMHQRTSLATSVTIKGSRKGPLF